MPKAKQFLKADKKKKPGKGAAQNPQDADEYLAAGVEFEEAGEKWRGGDAAKSTRFFIRAVDLYDQALRKFPRSFDLAYNKARVQYEITQHPKLAAQLPAPLLDLLRTALDSSRAALVLKQDNADALFNTAQVLTSLVEALAADQTSYDSLKLLEEAVELFQRCLTVQEYHFAEGQAQADAMESSPEGAADEDEDPQEDGGASVSTATATATPEEERWAAIIEPVTISTLIETILAQVSTLTTLCTLITSDSGSKLAWLEEYFLTLTSTKLTPYLTQLQSAPSPSEEANEQAASAALTRANFIAALGEAKYRNGQTDIATYSRVIDEEYSALDLSTNPEGLCDKAEAFISLDSALRSHVLASGSNPAVIAEVAVKRWKNLSVALQALGAAAKMADRDNAAGIHLARGDVELLRLGLGGFPWAYQPAATNAAALVKNAGTFYRGAEALATAASQPEISTEAAFKTALAACLAGDNNALSGMMGGGKATSKMLESVIEEGLVTSEWLEEKLAS